MTKMILAVVPRDQTDRILEDLITAGHTATVVDSRGGMLRQAQQMLFIAVSETELEPIIAVIKRSFHAETSPTLHPDLDTTPHETEVNGVLGQPSETEVSEAKQDRVAIFVWDLDRFEVW